jgi:RimJ/RimL family protein N-acetyltransferase
MLRGDKVVLRPIERDDVETLATWDHDYDTWPQTSWEPYVPKTVDDLLKAYDGEEESGYRATATTAPFAVTVDDELVGSGALWGIDSHNRRAHLGITLGPDDRGKGYGSDTCRVLLRYAFVDRGLHRVQLEVLADNEAAVRAYLAAGFREDGRMRESAWVVGRYVDELHMSVLSTDPGRHPGRG